MLNHPLLKLISIVVFDSLAALLAILLVNLLLLPTHYVTSLYVNEVWFLSILAVWLLTYDRDIRFGLDLNQTYIQVIKVAFWSAIVYLVFFTLTRHEYSLRYLLLTTLSWTVLTLFFHRWQRKISPSINVFTMEAISMTPTSNHKIHWKTIDKPEHIDLRKCDFLLLDFAKQYPPGFQKLFSLAHILKVRLLSYAQLCEQLTGKVSLSYLEDNWIQRVFYIEPTYIRLKRCFDLLLILLFFPLFIPLFFIVSLIIFLGMGRPIFFTHKRLGLNNKAFKIYKFRTMIKEARPDISASKDDLRITHLGRLLRKFRLDEIPQLYNVLKGDMSIIGPRPEIVNIATSFNESIPLYQVRHWVRPGITGWAQIMQGYTATEDGAAEKLEYDLYYLKNFSLWLDLLILFRTIWAILTGFGAR